MVGQQHSDSPFANERTRSGYDKSGSEPAPETPTSNQSRSGYDTTGTASQPPPQRRSVASLAQTSANFNVGLTLLVIITLAMWIEKSNS